MPAILIAFGVQSVQAQDGAPRTGVDGIVLDDSGSPIANANVAIYAAGRTAPLDADATNGSGAFSLDIATRFVGDGTLTIEVSHIGLATVRRTLDAPHERITIVLSSSVLPHSEVVVTASRGIDRISPLTVTNVSAEELGRKPSTKDIPAQLELTPSVTQYSENGNGLGYTYMQLRGFGQRRVAVTINGIPQNDPESFDVFWINFFDLQGSISDIQIQRGASGSFYGSTGIGGGINIVAMPYSPAPTSSVTLGLGSFGTRRFTAEANSGLLNDRYIVRGRASRVLSDGYRDWSWTEYWRYFAGIRRVGDNSVTTLQAYGGPQRDGLAYIGIPKAANTDTVTDDFGTEIDRRYNASGFTGDVEQFRQPHVELHHEWAPHNGLSVTQRAFWIKGEGYFDFDGSFRSADYLMLPDEFVAEEERGLPLFMSRPDVSVLFRAYLDQWQVGYQPSVRHIRGDNMTSLGAEVRLHRSLRWGRIQEAAGIPEELVGSDNDVRVYSAGGEKGVASLFASHLARPFDDLALQADAAVTYRRYRVFDEAFFGTGFSKPYLFFNPRVGATLFPDSRFSAYASIALANREPRLKSLYDGEEAGAGAQPQFRRNPDDSFDFDDPLVESETVVDVELGAAIREDAWEVSITGYYMHFRDEIVPSGGLDQFGVPRTGNAARTRHAGVEAEGRARVVPSVDVWANATVSRNRFIDFTEYVFDGSATVGVSRDGNTIAGFPGTIVNAGVHYTAGNLSIDLSTRFRGKQYVDNSNGRDLDGVEQDNLIVDAYQMVDVTVRYSVPTGPLRGLSAALDLTNLLDSKVLLHGNSGFGVPQFFPAATRHGFVSLTYTVR